MTPLAQLGWGLALGAGVGLSYDFLSPLRHRRNWLADLLFAPVLVGVWVHYSFGICLGQIRFATTAAYFLGLLAWEQTGARLSRPLFSGLWGVFFRFFRLLTHPLRKIFEIMRKKAKKVFASLKKRGKIKGNRGRQRTEKNGGTLNEKEKKSLFPVQDRAPSRQAHR